MILVISNGVVQQALPDNTPVSASDYPGTTIVYYNGTVSVGAADPRAPADQLAAAQAVQLAAVDAWYAKQTANGITIANATGPNTASITLPSSVDDQTRITSLGAMTHLAQATGQKQLTDQTGIADINNVWQAMTVAQLFTLLLNYGGQLLALTQQSYSYRQQITAATTVAAVNAITIPS